MADIAIDTQVTSQAASSFEQIAALIEQQVSQVRTQHQNVMVEGKGQWTNAFTADVEAMITELQKLQTAAAEIGRDLNATVQGFMEGDTTSAGYFTLV